MLRKANVKAKYEQIAILHNIFDTISSKNKELEEEYYKKHPQEFVRFKKLEILRNLEKEIIKSEQKLILRLIENIDMKLIVINLFKEMEKYNFEKDGSIPSHRISKLKEKPTRYDILSRVKLYEHTINCVICSFEICKKEKIPQAIADIIAVLAFLHDFGKSKKIISQFTTDTKITSKHNYISSLYVKKYFKKYINIAINEETYNALMYVLIHHHRDIKTTESNNDIEKKEKELQYKVWIELLRKSDALAREKEEDFYMMQYEISKKKKTKEEEPEE